MNTHTVIYEWKYVVPNGDINKKEDIGDRLELRKYQDGSFGLAAFSYEDDDGKKDVLTWFNDISETELKRLAAAITATSTATPDNLQQLRKPTR